MVQRGGPARQAKGCILQARVGVQWAVMHQRHDYLCIRGALSCQFGDRGQSQRHDYVGKVQRREYQAGVWIQNITLG